MSIHLLTGRSRATVAAAAAVVLVVAGAPVTAQAAELPDTPGSHGGLYVVEDALGQFVSLKHHGEALAWRNDESQGAIDPSIYDHYQGIARYPGTGAPVFYVTQSDDDDAGSAGGYLHIVRFGSRDTDGERLRSNLQSDGSDTEDVTPSTADRWVRSICIDGTDHDGVTLDAFKHPGGPAVIDDVLLVPVDQPVDEDNSPTGMILLFDLSADREDPVLVQAIELAHGIDNIGVTRNTDGSYLL